MVARRASRIAKALERVSEAMHVPDVPVVIVTVLPYAVLGHF